LYFFRFRNKEISTEKEIDDLPEKEPALIAMATCQSLTIIQNIVVGDPMDLKMFEFAKWVRSRVNSISNICSVKMSHLYAKPNYLHVDCGTTQIYFANVGVKVQ